MVSEITDAAVRVVLNRSALLSLQLQLPQFVTENTGTGLLPSDFPHYIQNILELINS